MDFSVVFDFMYSKQRRYNALFSSIRKNWLYEILQIAEQYHF